MPSIKHHGGHLGIPQQGEGGPVFRGNLGPAWGHFLSEVFQIRTPHSHLLRHSHYRPSGQCSEKLDRWSAGGWLWLQEEPALHGQCNSPLHGEMCRHICLHFPHSECTYTSAKRIPTYVPSIPLLQAPLWHSPSGLYIVEHRMCKWPTSEKGVVISEKYPQHMKSSRYRKSWPFQLITSKASGPATVQQLVLDSIKIDQTTLRRGCRDTGEEWSHRRIPVWVGMSWGMSSEQEDPTRSVEGIRDCLSPSYFCLVVLKTQMGGLVSMVSVSGWEKHFNFTNGLKTTSLHLHHLPYTEFLSMWAMCASHLSLYFYFQPVNFHFTYLAIFCNFFIEYF